MCLCSSRKVPYTFVAISGSPALFNVGRLSHTLTVYLSTGLVSQDQVNKARFTNWSTSNVERVVCN